MACNKHYDVILSDSQMPVMDGYQAVAAMRKHDLQQPIIALTANAMKGSEQKILESGFSHYMTKPIDIDALSKLLAELLGGKRVEKAEEDTKEIAVENTQESTQESTDQPLLYSRLADSEKLAPVVAKFITSVKDRFELMATSCENKDFTELAGHAHWLKGSGGTIGFDQLSEPARLLEVNAKSEQYDACNSDLIHIKSLINRLSPDVDPKLTNGDKPETVTLAIQESGTQAVEIVESSLLAKNPSFLPIVAKFLPRLRTQIEAMDKAVNENDFEELAALAHWLKGSGGTVGFDVFTKPATLMEKSAKTNDMEAVVGCLKEIKGYADKIVIPGSDNDFGDLKKSA